MENKLTINTGNGQVEIEVLDIFESPVYHRQYIVYKMPSGEDLYVSILNNAEDSYSLDNITDDQEFEHAMDLLNELLEEELKND